jgi:hypothetical protein
VWEETEEQKQVRAAEMGDGEAPTPPTTTPTPPPTTPTPPSSSSSSSRRIVVAIPLFDRFTALDAVGPYELLHTVPGVEVLFLGQQAGDLFATAKKDLKLVATASFEDVPNPDIVVVPGGPGCFAAAEDPALITWLLQVCPSLLLSLSMCLYVCCVHVSWISWLYECSFYLAEL